MYTFEEAQRAVENSRNKSTKPLCRNTYLEKLDNNTYGIRYHNTVVVYILRNGGYKINSGGYRSKTTKERINEFSPARVYQKKYDWFISPENIPFEDGMIFSPDGHLFFIPSRSEEHDSEAV